MKKYLVVVACALACLPFMSCQQESNCEDRAVGYVNVDDLKGEKWHIGTEASIKVYEKWIDAANHMDKDAMMALFADSAVVGLSNGFEMHGKDSISAGIDRWLAWADSVMYETVYVLSADLKPDTLGEWVFAGANHRQVAGGQVQENYLQMNFYVIDGLIHQVWTSRTDQYEEKGAAEQGDDMEEGDMEMDDDHGAMEEAKKKNDMLEDDNGDN